MTTFVLVWREDEDDERPWRVASTDNCDDLRGVIHAADLDGALEGVRDHLRHAEAARITGRWQRGFDAQARAGNEAAKRHMDNR